jgi:hypothetical protein
MTDDFQTIDGLGPAREEKLHDAGYETYADLATGDPEQLADEVSRLSEDSALEIIVQAQNLADLDEATIEEDPDVDSGEEPDTTDTEPQTSDSTEDNGETRYTVELTPTTGWEYDALYDCLLNYRQELHSTNRKGHEQVTAYIDDLRAGGVGDTVTITVDKDEMNELHNQLLNHRVDYQGRNFRKQMAAAKAIEQQFDEQREEFLF